LTLRGERRSAPYVVNLQITLLFSKKASHRASMKDARLGVFGHAIESNVHGCIRAGSSLRQSAADGGIATGLTDFNTAIEAVGVTDLSGLEAAVIRDHLEKLRSSAAFSRSSSLFAFLLYVVEETIAGRGRTLKELVVGDALYSNSTPYDPRTASTVRVEARRLRRKLADYYDREGRADPVRIELPTGSYRPVLATGVGRLTSDLWRNADKRCHSPDLAIMPFRALSSDAGDNDFVDGLTDELIFALQHRSQLKLVPRLLIFQYKNRTYALPEVAERLGVGAMLHGTFRSIGSRTRVTVELSDTQGFVTWSVQVDEVTTEPILLQEKLADAIVERMPAWIIGPPCKRSLWHLSSGANTGRVTPGA
jgi:TolB-like protein